MISHLIELQDYDISVRTPGEVLAHSPGFANISGKTPVYGDEAVRIARLHPRQNFNQFWAQLNLDPLPDKTPYFRHSADLAYNHLSTLTSPLDLASGAVIAAPSNYTRTQLSVLLGIVKQLPFNTVGLVDAALLQAAGSAADESIIIDLQLHQAVLSSFRNIDGHLFKDKVVQIPYAGLLALQDAWTGMITDEFIRQSRFDPHHNAETEQYLHNQLEQWLKASLASEELQLEINHKGSVHQARVTRAHFEQRSQTLFNRIKKEIDALRGPSTALHIKASHMNLPGLAHCIPDLIALEDEQQINSCMQYMQHIQRDPDSLQFVTRLPLSGATATSAPLINRTPTHALFQNKAILLPPGRLTFGAGASAESARVVPLTDTNFQGAISILRTARGLQLELHTSSEVLHNGRPAENGLNIQLGDRVEIGNGHDIQLIVVEGS